MPNSYQHFTPFSSSHFRCGWRGKGTTLRNPSSIHHNSRAHSLEAVDQLQLSGLLGQPLLYTEPPPSALVIKVVSTMRSSCLSTQESVTSPAHAVRASTSKRNRSHRCESSWSGDHHS
eukprot:2580127-Amphidinium_carterae.2